MKKQSKTTTVYRIDLVKGKYTTISRKILMNPKLRDSSKTLLQLILNNTDEWVLILGYYQRELKWSNDKMTGAVAELIQHGYLKKEKHSKGKDKGFYYTYIISEFGNLNPNKEQVSEEEILTSLKDDNFKLNNITDDSIPSEITEIEIVTESNETPSQPHVFVVDDAFWDKVIGVLDEEISGKANGEFVNKVVDYYIEQMQTGKLLLSNFDEEAVRKLLRTRLASCKMETLDKLNKQIELYNDKGTKDQRANIKAKALMFFDESLNNGMDISEAEVKKKIMLLKLSVIEANRNLDQRYQN